MAYGFNAWDANGNPMVGPTTLLWRYYGTYSASHSGGTQTGTITVSGIAADGNWSVFVTGSVISFSYKITADTITYQVRLPSTGTYTINFIVMRKGGAASSLTDYGLATFADSGDIQVDKSYDNYVLIASGNSIQPGLANAVSLPAGYTTDNCLILVRPTSSTGALQGGAAYWSGSAGTPPDNSKIYMNGAWNAPITTLGTGTATAPATNVPTTSTGTWDYRVYARTSKSATDPVSLPAYNSGYGLNIFDSNGNNVFCTNRNQIALNSFYTQTYTPGAFKTTKNLFTVNAAQTNYRTFIVYRTLNGNVEQIGYGNPPNPPFGNVIVSAYANWNSTTQIEVGSGCVRTNGGTPGTVNGIGYMSHTFMDSV